jgi:DNA-binding protein H-NS
MAINLDTLSPSELQALIKSAEAQMAASRQSHIRDTRAKIDNLLASAGLTLDEVYPRRGGKGAKSAKSAVAPKYRNPENMAQTWSGRGKRPLWFVAALKKKGVTAESLLIHGAAKAAPTRKRTVKATKKTRATK